MITVCPSCDRQFRIYARQLSAAGGRVQCGFCGVQFNALERLQDRPLPARSNLPPDESIPENTSPTDPAVDTVAIVTETPVPPAQETPADFLADELLLPEPPPRRSRLATVLWSSGVILLLLIMTMQLAWFHRDRLLLRYPEYAPRLKQFCQRYGCEPVRERDLDAIVLINRDVRDHPRYNNALLVNITIENRSGITQPYPGIQLTLFDNTGSVTGYRRLQPTDYLEPGTSIDTGMRPRLPLHLVFEVAETSKKPVGFEFGFF